jgi:hypothetical protein
MRLARYDEYFSDSSKKLNNIDQSLRLLDKKFSDEIIT